MAQPAGPEQFNPGWITAAVAVVALFRPELNALYRRRFQPGAIDVFETGFVEIGFGPLGPTVALLGTLHARHREHFVRRIDVTVTRERDHAVHNFDWIAFRSRGMAITDDGTSPMEFPTTIAVAPQQPARYHILFSDRDLRDEFLQHAQRLNREWFDYWKSKSVNNPDGSVNYADAQKTYDLFYQENRLLPYYTTFDHLFYWHPGGYSLEMRLTCVEPPRSYRKHWRFELTDSDVGNLRNNTVAILRAACNLQTPQWAYSYALPKYLPADNASAAARMTGATPPS
jgi:hypothetical protein